jgi:hypothetical protein
MVVRGSACRAAICTSRKSTPASSMVVTKVWRSMCGCIRGNRTTGYVGQSSEPPGRGVPVHPCPTGVHQDRPRSPCADRPVDRPRHRRWQRHQHHLGALAHDPQDAVPVFLTQVGDVRAGGFEDPQPKQAQHRHSAKS